MRKLGRRWFDNRPPANDRPHRRKGGKPAPAPWDGDPPGEAKPYKRTKRRHRHENGNDADA